MNTRYVAAAFLSASLVMTQAQASEKHTTAFWSTLDRNGVLSAGWVQVLPILAAACNLRFDNRELSSQLFDFSLSTGNESYASNLYSTLYRIEKHRAPNRFVTAWNDMFHGNQHEACETAERLWGESGQQFPGILKHEAQADVTSSIPANRASACQ